MDEEVAKLKAAGYDNVYVWDAEPNEDDPDHTRPFDTPLVVLAGEIEIVMNGRSNILRANDEINIPRETVHSGKAGAKGCKYIVAERH